MRNNLSKAQTQTKNTFFGTCIAIAVSAITFHGKMSKSRLPRMVPENVDKPSRRDDVTSGSVVVDANEEPGWVSRMENAGKSGSRVKLVRSLPFRFVSVTQSCRQLYPCLCEKPGETYEKLGR